MTEYTYNQIIEYIDGTYDENFSKAEKWAFEHNTTFEEDMEARDLPKRFFIIGDEPKPEQIPEPVEKEKSIEVKQLEMKSFRNDLLSISNWRLERYNEQIQLGIETSDTEEDIHNCLLYRQYLRDYTKEENWWERVPLDYGSWLNK